MQYSPTDDNFKSISTHKCKNRPGVATIMSGHVCIAWNCELIGSPPSTRIVFKSIYFPISLINWNVWTANSRVGDRISALAFVFGWRALSFSNSGIRKHAVLPEPKNRNVLFIAYKKKNRYWTQILYYFERIVLTCFSHSHYISSLQNQWNSFPLNWCWYFVSTFCYSFNDRIAQAHGHEATLDFGRFGFVIRFLTRFWWIGQIKTGQLIVCLQWQKKNNNKLELFSFVNCFHTISEVASSDILLKDTVIQYFPWISLKNVPLHQIHVLLFAWMPMKCHNEIWQNVLDDINKTWQQRNLHTDSIVESLTQNVRISTVTFKHFDQQCNFLVPYIFYIF